MLMSKKFRVLFSLLLPLMFIFGSSSILSSCGQSGPLYLPDSPHNNHHGIKSGAKSAPSSSSFLMGMNANTMNHPVGTNSSISRGA